MNLKDYFNSKSTLQLIQLNEHFDFLKSLIKDNGFPKALMLSGEKGSGKFTLISHLMHFLYDEKNYDIENYIINKKSHFHNQFVEGIFPNIIYLDSNKNNVKIENIRNLKSTLIKSAFNENRRFIILDDVERLNLNSLNALLKLIEEPGKNYFILINNRTKKILDTIKSRCIEIKILLNETERKSITRKLIEMFNQKCILDYEFAKISPGNFVKYNYIFDLYKIDLKENISKNLKQLIDIFKKEKDDYFKNLIFFYVEFYFFLKNTQKKKYSHHELENKAFIFKNLNDFFLYNLNQDNLINSIESRILNE